MGSGFGYEEWANDAVGICILYHEENYGMGG